MAKRRIIAPMPVPPSPADPQAPATDRYDALRSEEGRYRLLVNSITDYAIYMLDPSGVVVSWNPGAERFKGYRAEEIIGRHFSEFYTPEDRAAGTPELALHIAATAGKFEREGWRVRKDGGRFWAFVVIDAIRSPDGRLEGFAKITRDLTERRLAEETLRQTQEQFRLLVQGVTDYALYMLSLDGTIASWNQGAQRIKGYRGEEIIGSHFSRFYTEEDRQAGEPARALEAVRREGRFESEGWRIRKDGTRFWASAVIDAVRDDAGELIGFAKITRDITLQREARQALLQSQKLEAIGKLTGGVAHDFNNLLTAVLGSLELLRKRLPDDPKARNLLDNAVHGARRGAELTSRMLAFARRQEMSMRQIELPVLVRTMSDLLARSLGPGITIDMRFSETLPPVYSDTSQLELAILNLALNSRDAMPKGGSITIEASEATPPHTLAAELAGGPYVCLAVRDEGEGMDAATLARAVEPFFTTKGVGKGTGLGLALVHGFAVQSGGTLSLKSQPGQGTSAEIWLPVRGATEQPNQSPVPASSEAARDSLAILVVDDDPLVLMTASAMLEDMGHEVMAVRGGAEALQMLEAVPRIDLLLTDHSMPDMTGTALAREVRARLPALPIIIASGFAEASGDDDPQIARLAKPFTRSELQRALALTIAPTPPR